MKTVTRKNCLVVIAAIIAGFISGLLGKSLRTELQMKEYEEFLGVYRGDNEYMITSPLTELRLSEVGWDDNDDSMYDTWEVSIMEGSPTGARYYSDDYNHDGIADEVSVTIGGSGSVTGIGNVFSKENGQTQLIFVRLADDENNNNHYAYFDLDLDGRLDLFTGHVDSTLTEMSIIQKDKILRARKLDKSSNTIDVFDETGTWRRYELSGKKWVLLKESKNTEPEI